MIDATKSKWRHQHPRQHGDKLSTTLTVDQGNMRAKQNPKRMPIAKAAGAGIRRNWFHTPSWPYGFSDLVGMTYNQRRSNVYSTRRAASTSV